MKLFFIAFSLLLISCKHPSYTDSIKEALSSKYLENVSGKDFRKIDSVVLLQYDSITGAQVKNIATRELRFNISTDSMAQSKFPNVCYDTIYLKKREAYAKALKDELRKRELLTKSYKDEDFGGYIVDGIVYGHGENGEYNDTFSRSIVTIDNHVFLHGTQFAYENLYLLY